MFFLNLHVSTLDDETLATAEPGCRSTWLHLMRHCIGQENGGRIPACRSWTERKWLLLCRVTSDEVLTDSPLWKWEGDDLQLWGYPEDSEKTVRRKRRSAREANRKRWPDEPKQNTSADVSVNASEHVSDHAPEQQTELASVSALESDSVKGKGKWEREKRKGKEENAAVLPGDLADPLQKRIVQVAAIMHRRESTAWSAKELAAFRAAALDRLPETEFAAQLEAVAGYYAAPLPWLREHWERADGDFRRRDLLTLLNNWGGEVDRSEKFADWLRKKRESDDAGRLGGGA